MKSLIKILTALAAVAGVIYIVATYGEQIVAWCKKALASLPKCPCCKEAEPETVEEFQEEAAAEEAPAEEAEAPAEEPAPEVVVAENEPVAAEEDFAE